uniref:uncharacterized protein LOC105350365 n=1 Tax=Fragaria vesca subsp. vesca TaxID=101020 RepID=UPI0005CA5318|nr:PREDICTED: uncharacterized protein LOC105350365 [Fragaria vesca subsp. vesca]
MFTSDEDVEDDDGLVGSGEDVEEDSDEEEDEDSDDDVVAEGRKEVVAVSEEEIKEFNDPTTREICKEDLLLVCGRMGLNVREGHEDKILEMMFPYIRVGRSMYRQEIMFFMERVIEYIDSCCTLKDLKTVEAAFKYSFFDDEYGSWKIVKTRSREEDMLMLMTLLIKS